MVCALLCSENTRWTKGRHREKGVIPSGTEGGVEESMGIGRKPRKVERWNVGTLERYNVRTLERWVHPGIREIETEAGAATVVSGSIQIQKTATGISDS